MKKVLLGALVACALIPGVANAATEVVTPADIGTDWHYADVRPPGTGIFENGPATPPLGTGSFELNTPDGTAKVQLFTDKYDGVPLADIDGIGYSSYRDTNGAPDSGGVAMVALNFRIDTNIDGQPDAYLVFEPYQDQGNAAIIDNQWQTWDAYRGGQAKWWSGQLANCPQSTPCTWNQVLAFYPTATIQEGVSCGNMTFPKPVCPGSFGFNQGSGNPNTVSNGDALSITINGVTDTYDFELQEPPPTSADQCKNGGWATYGTMFKNQGDCVSFVKTGGKNEPGKNTKG